MSQQEIEFEMQKSTPSPFSARQTWLSKTRFPSLAGLCTRIQGFVCFIIEVGENPGPKLTEIECAKKFDGTHYKHDSD